MNSQTVYILSDTLLKRNCFPVQLMLMAEGIKTKEKSVWFNFIENLEIFLLKISYLHLSIYKLGISELNMML